LFESGDLPGEVEVTVEIRNAARHEGICSAEVHGSVDSSAYNSFEDQVREIVGEKADALILDMGGVDYISSMGIRSIFKIKQYLAAMNAKFAMANCRPKVNEVFEIMNIVPVLNLFDQVDDAGRFVAQALQKGV